MMERLCKASVFALVLFFIVMGVYHLIPSDYVYYEKIANHAYDAVSLLVVISVFLTFRVLGSKSREGRTWLLLFFGVLSWFCADVIWTGFIYFGIDPFPSIADLFYVMGYLLVFCALVSEFLIVKETVKIRDVVIAASAGIMILAMVLWSTMPLMLTDESLHLPGIVLLLFYVVGDIFIIFFAVLFVMTFGMSKASRSWLMIGAGLGMWSVADALFVYIEWHETAIMGVTDPLWIAGLLLIGLGAYNHRLIMSGEDG